MSKVLPEGKGLFIYQIKLCMGGDVGLIAAQAQALGLDWIAVKINRGYQGYNYRLIDPVKNTWADDYIPMLKAALDAVGVKLWGWGDVWLLSGRAEGAKALERVLKFGLEGYLIDAEGQAKSSPDRFNQAQLYTLEMEKMPGAVGLCSYRYPSMHRELPWQELLDGCDFHAPQIYWISATNPVEQWERSVAELRALRDLPFVPAGPMFYEHGWQPSMEEVRAFDAGVQGDGCSGVIYWEWEDAYVEGYFETLASLTWGTPEPEPEPEWKEWVNAKLAEHDQRLEAGGL